MGLFGFGNYSAPGPGVDKNAPKKKGFFLYVDIVIRKFVKLMSANALYFLFSLPMMAVIFILAGTMIENVIVGIAGNQALEGFDPFMRLFLHIYVTLLLFNAIGSGPVSAAYAYVMRCYVRGEHAWLMSDGWDKFKENFKNGMLLMLVDIIVLLMGSIAFCFYSQLERANAGGMATMFVFIKSFTVMLMCIYLSMHMYIYQIMVTYECKFFDLIKFSVMMSIAKLPITAVLSAVTGGVMFLILMIPIPPVVLIVYMVLGLTFTRFPLEFCASRVIEKNIKAEKKKQKKRTAKIQYLD